MAAALLLALGAGRARAAGPDGAGLDAKFTVSVASAPLGRLLEQISSRTGASFILAAGLDEQETVFPGAKGETAGEVLKTALESEGLTFHQVARTGTYVVLSRSQAAAAKKRGATLDRDPALDTRIRIRVTRAKLRDFLEMITAETKTSFTFPAGGELKRVTVDLNDVAAREALETVAELEELSFKRLGPNAFAVKPRPVVILGDPGCHGGGCPDATEPCKECGPDRWCWCSTCCVALKDRPKGWRARDAAAREKARALARRRGLPTSRTP